MSQTNLDAPEQREPTIAPTNPTTESSQTESSSSTTTSIDRGGKHHHHQHSATSSGGRHQTSMHHQSGGHHHHHHHHQYSQYPTSSHHGGGGHHHHERTEHPYHGPRSRPPHIGDQVSPCPNVDESQFARGPDPQVLQELKSAFSNLFEPTEKEGSDSVLDGGTLAARIFALSPHLRHIDSEGSALEAAIKTHCRNHNDSNYFAKNGLKVIVKAALMYYDIIGNDPLPMLGPIGNKKKKKSRNGGQPERGLEGEGKITWMWKSESKKSDEDPSAWKPYSQEESTVIEQTFQEGKEPTCPTKTNSDYSVDFETMVQFKVSDPKRSRPVRRVPENTPQPQPLKQEELEHTFTKLQCLSILSCAWLCLFPRQSARSRNAQGTLPGINFELMHWMPIPQPQGEKPAKNSVELAKNLCLLDYFDEMSRRWPEPLGELPTAHSELSAPTHAVNFVRRCADHSKHDPTSTNKDTSSSRKLLPVTVHPLMHSIDDMKDMIRTDFANMFIGGGVCCYGAVQEEISFTICPELIASRLIFPPMEEHEAIILVGAEQFSTIKEGTYAGSTQYGAPFKDVVSNLGAHRGVIAAIDAENYKGRDTDAQYTSSSFEREYYKSLAGFDLHSSSLAFTQKFTKEGEPSWQFPDAVATGNWGCGDFRGNVMYKILVQWLSCSAGGKQMHYFPFDRPELKEFEHISSYLLQKQEKGDMTWQQLYDDCIAGYFTPSSYLPEQEGAEPTTKTVFDHLKERYSIPLLPQSGEEEEVKQEEKKEEAGQICC